jgi:predicted O-methyltransferase YrrM
MTQRIILEELVAAYERRNLTVRVGLNPYHLNNYRDAPFACLNRDGKTFPFGGGISIQEIYFFEQMAKIFSPKRVFIIGNSFGWSTVALSLIFVQAMVVAIDNVSEGIAQQGLDLTNSIANELGLNAKALKASSPDDVGSLIESEFGGAVDLVFVDGLHTNEQQLIDYKAVKPYISEQGAITFHDVINWGMLSSFREIQKDWGKSSAILIRTPSGMGICYQEPVRGPLDRIVRLFSDATVTFGVQP